jgi:hypothetical protein
MRKRQRNYSKLFMHEFFLLKKKNSKLFLLKEKKKEGKMESLTLRMGGVGGDLGRPGMDGIGGGRRLSWAES